MCAGNENRAMSVGGVPEGRHLANTSKIAQAWAELEGGISEHLEPTPKGGVPKGVGVAPSGVLTI